MEIIYHPELLTSLRDKHLLIDTNVLRDAANHPVVFGKFFNTLKESEITLTTIDAVQYEILKGSASETKYMEKKKLVDSVIDAVLPLSASTIALAYELIKVYERDGSALGITDLMLGATLMQYKKSIFLMTRDTTDFIQSVFNASYIINAKHKKGIFTYGIYQYCE